jgi:hypothetical protein
MVVQFLVLFFSTNRGRRILTSQIFIVLLDIIRGFSSLSFSYCARFFELIRSQIGRPVAAAAAAVEDVTETGTTGPEDPGQF